MPLLTATYMQPDGGARIVDNAIVRIYEMLGRLGDTPGGLEEVAAWQFKEQNVIIDEQLNGIQKYVETYQNLDDAGALALINAHFDRDARMNALRQKWLGEFQKVLPTKIAVRAMQIDRRLSLVAQLEVAARIPLSH